MSDYAKSVEIKPEFIIALGDNFYTNGVASITDTMWETHWKQVYLQYANLNIPWHPIFGNHDYGYGQTGVQAQLDRSKASMDSGLWDFPATNYSKIYNVRTK